MSKRSPDALLAKTMLISFTFIVSFVLLTLRALSLVLWTRVGRHWTVLPPDGTVDIVRTRVTMAVGAWGRTCRKKMH